MAKVMLQMYECIVSESEIYNVNGEIGACAPDIIFATSSPHASLTIPSSFW